MRIKWECTGTPTIIKCDYAIDYVAVDSNGRRNRQCNTIIIVKLKKAKEHTAEAEVDVGQIDMFGPFSQGSSNPSPLPATQEKASQGKRTQGGRRRGQQQLCRQQLGKGRWRGIILYIYSITYS
jgi:hypothetical protein